MTLSRHSAIVGASLGDAGPWWGEKGPVQDMPKRKRYLTKIYNQLRPKEIRFILQFLPFEKVWRIIKSKHVVVVFHIVFIQQRVQLLQLRQTDREHRVVCFIATEMQCRPTVAHYGRVQSQSLLPRASQTLLQLPPRGTTGQ